MFPTHLYRSTDVIRETEKAICVRTGTRVGSFNQNAQHGDRPYQAWLPKSQIEFRSDVYGEHLFVARWLLGKLA